MRRVILITLVSVDQWCEHNNQLSSDLLVVCWDKDIPDQWTKADTCHHRLRPKQPCRWYVVISVTIWRCHECCEGVDQDPGTRQYIVSAEQTCLSWKCSQSISQWSDSVEYLDRLKDLEFTYSKDLRCQNLKTLRTQYWSEVLLWCNWLNVETADCVSCDTISRIDGDGAEGSSPQRPSPGPCLSAIQRHRLSLHHS